MLGKSVATLPRRRLTASVAALLAFLLASVFVSVAPAAAKGPPRTGTGTGVITSIVETSSRDAGPNRIAERVLRGEMLTGPLSGTFKEEVRGVVHPNGTVTFHGTLSFSGTLEGCGEGKLKGRLAGRGTAGAAPVTDANVALVGGHGATIPASGQGRFHQAGLQLTYEIRYVCR